jgi:hypothetical protein
MAADNTMGRIMELAGACRAFVREVEAGEHPEADPEVVELSRRIAETDERWFKAHEKCLAAFTGRTEEQAMREETEVFEEYLALKREIVSLAEQLAEHTL